MDQREEKPNGHHGEVGVGKTVLLYALLKDLSQQIKTAFIFNPRLDFKDLLKNILHELQVPTGGKEEDRDSLKLRFAQYLQEGLGKDETVTIIIDEAQNLEEEVLEELGRLLDLATPITRVLQILLVGQPELDAKLNSERLRFLKDRIAIHEKIIPLTREEGIGYIGHRLKMVGRNISEVLTSDAATRIWSFAGGIPRVMNLLCDRALFIGYLDSRPIIDSKIAQEAIKDFSHLQPIKSKIFRPVSYRPKSHYPLIGIVFFLLGGLVFFSLFLRYSNFSIIEEMAFPPSKKFPAGNVGNILPSEEQPIKTYGHIPFSEKSSPEKQKKEMIPSILTPPIKPGPSEGPKVAAKKEAPSEKQTRQPPKAKGYIIQVGAMGDLNRARDFVEKQKRSGQQVQLAKIKIKGEGVLYIIYFGSFADQPQAARYMKENNVKGSFPHCFIRRTPK